MLHLQGFSSRYNLNDPSWSISVEMAAYLLFPIFIYVGFNGPRVISLAFFLVGTLVISGMALTLPRLGLALRSVPFDLVRCFTEFGYGMLVYRMFCTQGPLRTIGGDAWTWGITALSVTTLVLRFDLLAAFSFPLVVLAWAWNTGSASRIMSSRVPYFFGVISFSIYPPISPARARTSTIFLAGTRFACLCRCICFCRIGLGDPSSCSRLLPRREARPDRDQPFGQEVARTGQSAGTMTNLFAGRLIGP